MQQPEVVEDSVKEFDQSKKDTIQKKLPTKDRFTTPSFSSDINALLSDIKSETADDEGSAIPFTKENVQELWKAYKEKLDTSTTKTSLEAVEIDIEADTIIVYVPNLVSKEYILQENELIGEIRLKMKKPDLALKLVVDASRFPDFKTLEPKKVLSDQEKYKLLVEKNPMVETLFKKFSLKVDK